MNSQISPFFESRFLFFAGGPETKNDVPSQTEKPEGAEMPETKEIQGLSVEALEALGQKIGKEIQTAQKKLDEALLKSEGDRAGLKKEVDTLYERLKTVAEAIMSKDGLIPTSQEIENTAKNMLDRAKK